MSRANQLRDILLFLVRQTLLAPEAAIRESEIAHRVLGRRSDFNPLDDNIVRVQMAHLRKKLDLFFATEGKEEEVILKIALGSYKPIFSSRIKPLPKPLAVTDATTEVPAVNEGETLRSQKAEASTELVATVSKSNRRPNLAFVSLAAALILAAACAVLSIHSYRQQQELKRMQTALMPWKSQPALAAIWGGFLDSSHETDIVIGDNSLLLIEQLTGKLTPFDSYVNRSYLNDPQLSSYNADRRFLLDLLARKTMGSTSEFKFAHRIMSLDPQGQKLRMFSARQYTAGLLKQDNVILVGGRVSNPWQNAFSDKLNFVEEMMFKKTGQSAVTNLAPHQGESSSFASSEQIGYCAISYFPDPVQKTYVLLISGTNAEATEAAGDFLLSEEQLSSFLAKLNTKTFPPFEVLLKITQVRGTPLNSSIEAYRVYPMPH